MARRKMPGGSHEEQTPATADVEDLLIATPVEQRKHAVAVMEFPYFDIEQKQKTFAKEKSGRPVERARKQDNPPQVRARRGNDRYRKTEKTEKEKVSKYIGRINSIVGPGQG